MNTKAKKVTPSPKKLNLVSHLERHTFAPELNKLHLFTGDSIRVPGATTIDAARQMAQPKLLQIEADFNKKFPMKAAA